MILRLTGCEVDLSSGRVTDREGLTAREVDLLRFLVERSGQIVTREHLLAEVWGYSDQVVSRACDNAIRRLRSKVEVDPAHPDHVLTVHGSGYRFEALASAAPVPEEVSPRPLVRIGTAQVDLGRRRVHQPDGTVELTETEARVLRALVRADGRVVEHATLVKAGWEGRASTRALAQIVVALRAKLERGDLRLIHTARGTGYKLERAAADEADLIGREREVSQILAALDASPWVLLLGPAGAGKSRLTRHVAPLLGRSVAWVDLTAARSAADGVALMAAALNLQLGARDPMDQLGEALAERGAMLGVLDHLEQAPADMALLVSELRRRAPQARWLGASRVRLGVAGERLIEIGPLSPRDAITLFQRRATEASVDASLSPEHLETLTERLDRLPLAIELAAPRLRVLSLQDLIERLDVDLLVHPHAPDKRHRSLRAAIGASLDGLLPEAFEALSRVSLLVTGLFVEDAEALFGEAAIDLLQTLRDHSLLQTLPGPRFVTWHAVRELLDEDRDPEQLREHCTWMALRGDADHIATLTPGPAAVRHRLRLEDDLAAARMALAVGDAALAGRCARAALWTLGAQGPVSRARAFVDVVLAADPPGPIRAPLLYDRATFAWQAGDREAALLDLDASAALGEEFALPNAVYQARILSSEFLRFLGRLAEARARLVEAMEAGNRASLPGGKVAEADLAWHDGDKQRSIEILEATVARLRAGSPPSKMLPVAIDRLSRRALDQGQLDRATRFAEEAYALCRERELASPTCAMTIRLLTIAAQRGDGPAVERWLEKGTEICRQLDLWDIEAGMRTQAAIAWIWLGRQTEARAILAEIRDQAQTDAPWLRPQVSDGVAQAAVLQGDPPAAITAARQSAAAALEQQDPRQAALAERHLVWAALVEKDLVRARVHARALREAATPDAPVAERAMVACWEGRLAVAEGDLDAARSALERALIAPEIVAGATELRWVLQALQSDLLDARRALG